MNQALLTARFVSFEGVDGAGKSTHIARVREYLESQGQVCVFTREPGGTPVGECLRELVLHQPMHAKTQLLLMYAARHQHVVQCIVPALQQGHWVLCDRFEDSSFAYQANAAGLGVAECEALSSWALAGFAPSLTFLFDLPVEQAKERVHNRNPSGQDEFERQSLAYAQKVREGFLQRAKAHPQRICVMDASPPEAQVGQAVLHQFQLYWTQNFA